MNSSRILYYPYASISNIDMVKRAVLYFDEIHLLDPFDANTDDPVEKSEDEWFRLKKELSYARIIKRIHPREYIKKDFKVISDNIIQDLESKAFWKLCEPYLQSTWKISKAKIPEDFESDTRLRQLLLNLPGYIQSSPGAMPKTLEKMAEMQEFTEDSIYNHPVNISPQFGEERQEFFRHSMNVIQEREFEAENSSVEYRIVKNLPFPLGESLMINHALRITHHNPDLIPFTDDALHDAFLRLKHQQISKTRVIRSLLHEADMLPDLKQNIGALQVLNLSLPDMKKVPMGEIMKLRKHRAPELEAFRARMNELANRIETDYWEKSFANEVKKKYASELKKELVNLKGSIQSLKGDKWKWIPGTAGSILGMSSIPLAFSVLPAMPVPLIIAATSGIYALEKYLDQRKKKHDLRRNGVAFLFRLNELQSRF